MGGNEPRRRVMAGWDELGREPNLDEVAWFDLPEQ